MKACEIFHVPQKKGYRWKWRHTGPDGRTVVESHESYALYYECLTAARDAGYQPRQHAPADAQHD